MNSYRSAKEELKGVVNIAELIGQFVQLKRVGLNYVGLCPFHPEKDPSFSVSPSKQMFHCFGCKKGGDIFAFWMDYHHVSFPQALQDLAEKYNVTIEEKPFTAAEKKKMAVKQSLFSSNDIAAEYYHGILMESKGGHPARNYLQKRSLPTDIIDKYRLGYAPDEWDGLVRHLRHRSVDVARAVQAGLIIPKKNGGYYDRFRGRIIFPIQNLRKQIVGFGARVLDNTLPKYLNTPETPIFHKGDLLYGLHEACDAIRKS
ncbi:MAG: DNA primase, partial [Deltaproteobacteria bacterium]|nr:DNA primase [Deltaproteobacteria bacterium]